MRTRILAVLLALLAVFTTSVSVIAADSLAWRVQDDRVDAQIEQWPLQRLLPAIAKATGWKVYVEPGTSYTVSAKFKNLSSSEALRRLLGRVNFSVSRTNKVTQLYVYSTDIGAATELVRAEKGKNPKDYLLANELVVRLKKGSKTSIEELAKQLGAKIVGRDDAFGIYRLQFDSAEAAAAARESLKNNSDVAWVDSNYLVDPPNPVNMELASGSVEAGSNKKDVNPCSPTIGLIDTAFHMQPGYSNYVLSPISVVGDVTVSEDHPTHADGMIESINAGSTNSQPRILPVVAYSNGSSTTTFEIANAITAMLRSTNSVGIINLSCGGTGDSAYLSQLIQDVQKLGIVVVAAAGNEPGTTVNYPAAWPGVIAVTASDSSGRLAQYANSGDFVKAMATGTCYTTYDGRVWRFEGTSVSAAEVSGMLGATAGSGCVSASSIADQVVSSLPVKK
jgi:hypothetical protein